MAARFSPPLGALLLGVNLLHFPWPCHAADVDAAAPAEAETWSAHGQATSTVQSHGRFTSPYAGPNSLGAEPSTRETVDATLFLGARLWRGGEFYLNPEVDQGFGLSDTVGVAGFPSGEAYKVGHHSAYARLDRWMVRQVVDLGPANTAVEPGPNALAGPRAADRLTVTIGKFAVTDLFDTNAYAHDSKADFLNWSIVDAGAFDYAADAWGYTYGAAAEWTQGRWTLRGGAFALSRVPNGEAIDTSFRQHALVAEAEMRMEPLGQPGAVRLLAFLNHGRMGRYDDALAAGRASGTTPSVSSVQRMMDRGGVALNLEQSLSQDLGLFARASKNDGRKQTYEFTDINASVATGLKLEGCGWRRCQDSVGVGAVQNQLSSSARSYVAAGGLGLLVGDGQLPHEGSERILEAFYAVTPREGLSITADSQRIVHPAYNRDRGPVSVYSVRAHAEF